MGHWDPWEKLCMPEQEFPAGQGSAIEIQALGASAVGFEGLRSGSGRWFVGLL